MKNVKQAKADLTRLLFQLARYFSGEPCNLESQMKATLQLCQDISNVAEKDLTKKQQEQLRIYTQHMLRMVSSMTDMTQKAIQKKLMLSKNPAIALYDLAQESHFEISPHVISSNSFRFLAVSQSEKNPEEIASTAYRAKL